MLRTKDCVIHDLFMNNLYIDSLTYLLFPYSLSPSPFGIKTLSTLWRLLSITEEMVERRFTPTRCYIGSSGSRLRSEIVTGTLSRNLRFNLRTSKTKNFSLVKMRRVVWTVHGPRYRM